MNEQIKENQIIIVDGKPQVVINVQGENYSTRPLTEDELKNYKDGVSGN